MSTAGLRVCDIMWFKLAEIKGAQLKISLHYPVVHRMLIKNGKRTMMIRCILTEVLECKVHEKRLCLFMPTLRVAIALSGNIRLP